MKKLLSCLAVFSAAAGCAAPPPQATIVPVKPVAAGLPSVPKAPIGAFALKNPHFDAEMGEHARCATGWSCTMHGDPNSFRYVHADVDGRRAFCIEPITREPWALLTQGTYDGGLRGMRLRFSMSQHLTGVTGDGAGIWVHMPRPRPPNGHVESVTPKSNGWETRSVEFDVPDDSPLVEVGVILRGKGRACFDDARLEVLRPAKNPV
ncbi:MAG: hypothetical protein ABIQ72_00340 [Usitatibacter sp.]